MRPKQTHCYFKLIDGDWLLLRANVEPVEITHGPEAGGVWVENRVAALGSMAHRQEEYEVEARRAVAAVTDMAFQRGYVRGQGDCTESYEPILEKYRAQVIGKEEEIRDLREGMRSLQDARVLDAEG